VKKQWAVKVAISSEYFEMMTATVCNLLPSVKYAQIFAQNAFKFSPIMFF